MARNKTGPARRVEPLGSLPAGAQAIWREITGALPTDFFGPQDRYLLAQYCYAAWRGEREIARDRRKAGQSDAAVIRESVRVLGKLGPQLRLSPSSRIEPRTAGTARGRAGREMEPLEAGSVDDWRAGLKAIY